MTIEHQIRFVACCGLAVALSGCTRVQDAFSEKPRVGVVALFDTSASTNQEALRKRYGKEFIELVDKASPQGLTARADVIRATPLADTVFPLHIDLPRASVNRNNITQEELLTSAKKSADEGLSRLFSENVPTQNSRILDAIEVTSRLFNGAEMREMIDRRLVVFSDMIESSERYEFTRGVIRRDKIASMIEKEKTSGRIPTLKGVRVWVAGAGSGGGTALSSDQLRGIEQFWLEYFRATGADLAPSQYGASLLNFDVPK
jgi:hypothetical protein